MTKIVESLRQVTLIFDIVAIYETFTKEHCIHCEIPEYTLYRSSQQAGRAHFLAISLAVTL